MKTKHISYFSNSSRMIEIDSEKIDLIITSPPYPMIEMWDSLFSSQDANIKNSLSEENGKLAFDLMHKKLNEVWKESIRVLKEGGIICINIGDATRKIGKTFQLFPNHIKIVDFFQNNGCIVLPSILWRKPTNSPTKFMGSGMIPPNAYVSLEHEYILIFRKGKRKRKFEPKSEKRYNSAYFWEERNKWFSDIWIDIRGTSQTLKIKNNENLRDRSAAFPLELPYRLINMFSTYGDNILDPFWGTGTTSIAAMILARNSYGYEINSEFSNIFDINVKKIEELTEKIITKRISKHIKFVKKYSKKKTKEIKYDSKNYKFPVITNQEKNILFYKIKEYQKIKNGIEILHEKFNYEGKRKKRTIQSKIIH